jgi:hypothetical protein
MPRALPLRLALLPLALLLADCNCGKGSDTFSCRYQGADQVACYNCPSASAANTCVEVGPSRAECDTAPVACP